MSRVFIFIDESGDAGKHTDPASSQYYQLNIVIATREMLGKIALQFSRFRYFTDAEKEIDSYLRWEKTRKKIMDIFSHLANGGVNFLIFRIEKSRYVWPYYDSDHFNPKKFRNFMIRMALEKTYKYAGIHGPNGIQSIDEFESIEVVIDRFLDSQEDEQNLRTYLKNNYRLPKILHIVQIDSEYSEHIQCADVLWKLVKKLLEIEAKNNDTDFVKIIDLSNPHGAFEFIKEKGPDTQGGTRPISSKQEQYTGIP